MENVKRICFVSFVVLVAGLISPNGHAFEFGEIGPVEVPAGETVIVQIEDFTPAADTQRYSLELDPDVNSGIILRSDIDGRIDEFPLTDEVQLQFNIQQAGTYYLFANVNATGGGDDSFFVGIDGDVGNGDEWRNNTSTRNNWAVEWVTSQSLNNDRVEYQLSAGMHTLNWHMRESDSRVDWVGITDDPNLNLSALQAPEEPLSIVIADRQLSGSVYIPGEDIEVMIEVENVGNEPSSAEVKETPPSGWGVSNISNGGTESDGTITWTVSDLGGGQTTTLSYTLSVPSDATGGEAEISGQVIGDLGELAITGARTLLEAEEIGIFDQAVDWYSPENPRGNTKVEGEVNVTGSGSNTEYELFANGDDIWNESDEGLFVFTEKKGSWALQGQVTWFDPGTNDWSKIGVMVRENAADPFSRHYWIELRGAALGDRVDAQWRTSTGSSSGNSQIFREPGVALEADLDGWAWLRVMRVGDQFISQWSDDGEDWVTAHTQTQPDWPEVAAYGLAITSHTDDDILVHGVARNVELKQITFDAQRILPGDSFTPGEMISGVQVQVNVAEGASPDLDITEIPPEGWDVSNVQATQGDAAMSNGNIEWEINGASGTPTLSYDLLPSADASIGSWSGSATDGEFTFPIAGDGAMTNSLQKFVYFVAGGDPTLPRNTVYMDLLGDGLTLLDADLNEVFIPGLGFEVQFADEDVDSPAEALAFDLVIVHESLSSGNAAGYGDLPVPYLMIEQALIWGDTSKAASLYFAPSVLLPEGDVDVEIIDNTHPITERYDQGQVIQVTFNFANAELAGPTPDNLAPVATPLASSGSITGENRIVLAVAEEGETGLSAGAPAGFEPLPARRGFIGYHENVHVFENDVEGIDNIAMSPEGAILFQRVIQWMVGNPVNADGTEEGVPVEDWALY